MPGLTSVEDHPFQYAKIKVIGVGGGGGGKILNNMIKHKLCRAEFVFVCTDTNALQQSLAETKLQLGAEDSLGPGSYGSLETGRNAAMGQHDQILELMNDIDMVFIVAGMGGGTGTGAAPVIAEVAKGLGLLTAAVVTKPLWCEGKLRICLAEKGIAELSKVTDTLIIIPNQLLAEEGSKANTSIQ